jgi:hypothetical protein
LEYRLGSRNDMTTQVGKCMMSLTWAISGVTSVSLGVTNFNASLNGIATYYTRWRIASLRIFFPISPFTGSSAVCVLDDTNLSDDLPSSLEGVYETRTSALLLTNTSATMNWKPMDRSKWFYTYAESSSADTRSFVPGTVCMYAPGGSGSMLFEVFYTIELAGRSG